MFHSTCSEFHKLVGLVIKTSILRYTRFYAKMVDVEIVFGQRFHSKLRSITPVATKVHVILRSSIVFTWMRVPIGLV